MSDENKFKPTKNNLGLDVKYETEALEVNPTAQKLLHGAGEMSVGDRGTYRGSFAVHIFTNTFGNQMGVIEQFSAHDVSEQVLLTAYQTLGIHLARRFGHAKKTLNRHDKR